MYAEQDGQAKRAWQTSAVGSDNLPGSKRPKHAAAEPVLKNLPPLPVGRVLLDNRVEVWWGGDAQWYAGTVARYDEETCSHTILYDDGIEVLHDFTNVILTPCRLMNPA